MLSTTDKTLHVNVDRHERLKFVPPLKPTKMPHQNRDSSDFAKDPKRSSKQKKRTKTSNAKSPVVQSAGKRRTSKQTAQAQNSTRGGVLASNSQSSPDPFADSNTTQMASAFPIWEASNILTQRDQLDWQTDPDGKLCYARQVGDGKGAIHFWVTENLEDEHPATLAGAAALTVIDTFDIRAACMHLLYAAYATQLSRPWEQELVIEDRQIEQYLGLHKRTDKNRQEKLALIEEIAKQPCKITTFISWPNQGKVKRFSVSEGRLWHILETQYHFQTDLFDKKELTGITFIVKPGLWSRYFLNDEGRSDRTAYYQTGPLSRNLLEDVMSLWQHREGAARLIVWLLFQTQITHQNPLSVYTLMEVAYGVHKVQEARVNYKLRMKLANLWDSDLLTLHERGWKLTFDSISYPPEIQPPGFGRGARLRPRGFFDKLLKSRIWVNPLEDLQKEKLDQPLECSAQPVFTGAQVKSLRKSRGWSQMKMQAITGISQGQISLIENDERPITYESEEKLKKAFGLKT